MIHDCPACGEEDAAVGHPSAYCDDCEDLASHDYAECTTCNRLCAPFTRDTTGNCDTCTTEGRTT